jgi:hypothetical protein
MAAKKKTEVYKSAAAMKKHEKAEGKKMEKKEMKAGMGDKVKAKSAVKKMTAPKRIAKSI